MCGSSKDFLRIVYFFCIANVEFNNLFIRKLEYCKLIRHFCIWFLFACTLCVCVTFRHCFCLQIATETQNTNWNIILCLHINCRHFFYTLLITFYCLLLKNFTIIPCVQWPLYLNRGMQFHDVNEQELVVWFAIWEFDINLVYLMFQIGTLLTDECLSEMKSYKNNLGVLTINSKSVHRQKQVNDISGGIFPFMTFFYLQVVVHL